MNAINHIYIYYDGSFHTIRIGSVIGDGKPVFALRTLRKELSWLVVDHTPLKNMSSSVGLIIPNIWKSYHLII